MVWKKEKRKKKEESRRKKVKGERIGPARGNLYSEEEKEE